MRALTSLGLIPVIALLLGAAGLIGNQPGLRVASIVTGYVALFSVIAVLGEPLRSDIRLLLLRIAAGARDPSTTTRQHVASVLDAGRSRSRQSARDLAQRPAGPLVG
jgi:hypothetical protein